MFDNVEDLDDLHAYFPLDIKTHGSVIITTQKTDFFAITDTFKTIHVSNFDREEGSALIFKYLQRDPLDNDEVESARRISDLLDGLPLALATIGGYINQTNSVVAEYLENLRTSSKAWEAGSIGPAKQYEKTLATVFDIAFKELSPKARHLLDILAFLSPDNIPENILTDRIGKSSLSFLKSKSE